MQAPHAETKQVQVITLLIAWKARGIEKAEVHNTLNVRATVHQTNNKAVSKFQKQSLVDLRETEMEWSGVCTGFLETYAA